MPCESQKTVAMTFPADGTVFDYFGARSPHEVHCFDCSFISGVYWWLHVWSTVTKRRRNSFGLRLNMSKQCSEVVMRFRFCFTERKRGTHLADSFLMPNFSCGIFCMHSVEMSTMSAMSLIFYRRSANTISWIFLGLLHRKRMFGQAWIHSTNIWW